MRGLCQVQASSSFQRERPQKKKKTQGAHTCCQVSQTVCQGLKPLRQLPAHPVESGWAKQPAQSDECRDKENTRSNTPPPARKRSPQTQTHSFKVAAIQALAALPCEPANRHRAHCFLWPLEANAEPQGGEGQRGPVSLTSYPPRQTVDVDVTCRPGVRVSNPRTGQKDKREKCMYTNARTLLPASQSPTRWPTNASFQHMPCYTHSEHHIRCCNQRHTLNIW